MSKSLGKIAVAILTLYICVVSANQTQANPNFDFGDLVFTSCTSDTLENTCELKSIRLDGLNQTIITSNKSVYDGNASWFKSGGVLFFTTGRYFTGTKIASIDTKTKKIAQVSFGNFSDSSPNLSKNGMKIVFTRDFQIFSMSVNGREPTPLTTVHSGLYKYGPTWSPDGKKIVFAAEPPGGHVITGGREIYVMDQDGQNVYRLTNNAGDNFWPDWAPGGEQIIFASNRSGDYDIYTMNVDGKNQKLLFGGPGSQWQPRWSPDGSKIAFASDIDGDMEIYVADASVLNVMQITRNTAWDGQPVWQEAAVKTSAELITKQEVASAKLQEAMIEAINGINQLHSLVTKKATIVCMRGNTTKRIHAINPRCPAGYDKK